MKTAALAVVVASILIVTGCSSGAAPAATSAPPSAEAASGEIEVMVRHTIGSDTAALFDQMALNFTKATGVKVKVFRPQPSDFNTVLQQRAVLKNLPDVIINDAGQLGAFMDAGYVREVDKSKIPNSKLILGNAWKPATSLDGKIFAVPYDAQASALTIRKDWREKLKLPVPKTWADLAALSKAFTTEDPDGNGQADTFGLAAPLTSKNGYAGWYSLSFIWSNGGNVVKNKADGSWVPSMTDPKTVSAVKWLRGQVCDAKTLMPGAVSMDSGASAQSFQAGQTGLYVIGPYQMSTWDVNPGKDTYEVVPFPAGPDGNGKTQVLAEGKNIYLTNGSKNEAGQNAFANYAVSQPAQEQMMGLHGERPDVNISVNTKIDNAAVRGDDPRWGTYADQYANDSRYVPNLVSWPTIRQDLGDTLNAVFADCSLNLNDRLSQLNDTLKPLLAKELPMKKSSK